MPGDRGEDFSYGQSVSLDGSDHSGFADRPLAPVLSFPFVFVALLAANVGLVHLNYSP